MGISALETAKPRPEGRAYVLDWFRRWWLAVWFITIDLYVLYRTGVSFGPDATYMEAGRRLWSGEDPWSTSLDGWWFGAPPPTVLVMAPFALLPDVIAGVVLSGLTIAAAVYVVRKLRLPWFWLAFPPLTAGGFDTWAVALILAGWGWAASFAKLYAVVPLAILGQWRQLALFGVALLVTAPFLPWQSFLEQYPDITARLGQQAANLSAPLIAVPLVLVCLILMGREKAAWMAVPALWPSTQWYYGVLAVPALSPLAGAIMAVPSEWSVVLACGVLTVTRVRAAGPGRWRSLRRSSRTAAGPARSEPAR